MLRNVIPFLSRAYNCFLKDEIMSLDFIISFLFCFECLAFNPDLLCLIDVNFFSHEIFNVVGCILVLIVLVRLLFQSGVCFASVLRDDASCAIYIYNIGLYQKIGCLLQNTSMLSN